MKISSTAAPAAPLCAATLLRGPIEHSLRRSAAMGFDGVELQVNLAGANPPDYHAVRALCDALGIAVSAHATGALFTQSGLSLTSASGAVAAEALGVLCRYVDAAAVTGGKVIVGCVRGNTDSANPPEVCLARLAEAMKRLLDYAAGRGVEVVLEAINRYENNYLATAAQCAAFLAQHRLDGLGILLDTFHMNLEETSFAGAVKAAGWHLRHVHLADNTRKAPGMGMLDFPAIIRALREQGYGEWLSLECGVLQDEDAEALAGLRHVRRALAREDAG